MWLKITIDALLYPLEVLVKLLIYLYKFLISPMFSKNCRFYPSCSNYVMKAIDEWGLVIGLWLGLKRIVRCRPGVQGGEDFVPLNIKGDLKWIY